MTKQRPTVVAVDGPAGSGKSSLCRKVASRVGWTYVNTGALYRAIGLLACEAGIDLDDQDALARLVAEVADDLRWDGATHRLWCGSRDLTLDLGAEKTGSAASRIARSPKVRTLLLPVQRQLALSAERGVLLDGRDIGTVVFPDAELKVFLTASLEERSRRRLTQLGESSDRELSDIKASIAARDSQDSGRDVAPLEQAADAVVLDTSSMDLEESVQALIQLIKVRGLL